MTTFGIQKLLRKKSTTTLDETSLGKIISEMQQNGKIYDKFKIVNPIYEDKNFAEDPIEILPTICNENFYISEKSVDTASNTLSDKTKSDKIISRTKF